MVKNYVDKSVKRLAKINRKHYNTPKELPDTPLYRGALFDILEEPDQKYVEAGAYIKQFKLQKLNKVKLPKSSWCYTNRWFADREEKCKFELPIENVEVNAKQLF